MRHVYWIGGGSGAGKSTVARILADRHDFRMYDTDAAMTSHTRRASQAARPFMQQFLAMDMDQRWVNRTPYEMFETFRRFHGEGFESIIDDVLAWPRHPPVMVEGFRLIPSRVAPLLGEPRRAVWLLPAPEFRRAAFERRRPSGPPWTFVDATSDPPRALANLLERDRLFTERLRRDVRALGLPALEIDVNLAADDVVEMVSLALGL